MGDSNTIISYFKVFSKNRWSYIIGKKLGLKVAMLGRDGAKTKDRLTYESVQLIKRINAKYYIICYGLNDKATCTVSEFEDHTKHLIKNIQRTKGIPILMTNLSTYYPPHLNREYVQTRELAIEGAKRKISKELGIPLIDVFARFEKEAEKGNWDTRIRNQQVFDNSQDEGKTIESGWFGDIHYNVEGNRIVADEIVKYFKENILK